MRKLIEGTFVSLDGVVESPEKWVMPYFVEENKKEALDALEDVDTFLLGRVTYEKFAATWSQIKGDPYFDKINALPKLVASTTLRETTWNAQLIKGDVVEAITKLKRGPGKAIMKYGTSRFDRTLVQAGLVDEFRLFVVPVVLGSGQRLFEGFDARPKFTLTGVKTFRNGVLRATYVPA
jgi:dihydrofolate reductase